MGSFPFPYGSDIHWLWGWGQRIAAWQDEGIGSEMAWAVFRPDELADKSMMRYSIDYPGVVQELRSTLAKTEDAFSEVQFDCCERTESALANLMELLSTRIITAADIIAEREGIPVSRPASQIRARSKDTADSELSDIIVEPERPNIEQRPTEQKIKPTSSTVEIIRLLEAGRSVDEITLRARTSAGNVRKVRSLLKQGKYEI